MDTLQFKIKFKNNTLLNKTAFRNTWEVLETNILETNFLEIGNMSGNSSNTTMTVFTTAEDTALKAFYILISIANFASNSMVIFIIGKEKQFQNTINLLIVNLLSADIVAGLAVYPYLFIEITIEDNEAGRADLMCGLKNGLTMFLAAATVNFMTLCTVSLSRYLMISHPTKPKWRIRKNYVKWISMLVWLISILALFPNIVSYRYVPEAGICDRKWPGWINATILFVITAVIYSVTLFSLLFTFGSTIRTFWLKGSTRLASNNTSALRSRRKATTILGLLLLAFLICWLPFAVYWVLSAMTSYFSNTLSGNIKKVRAIRYTILFAFLNTCLDPIIYTLGNSQIKAKALEILRRRKPDRKDSGGPVLFILESLK